VEGPISVEETTQDFSPCWAIVEIFGHQRFAGQISEQPIAGDKLVRVEVPPVPEVSRAGRMSRFHPHTGERAPQGQVWRYTEKIPAAGGFTKLLGVKAIYALTPTPEATVRALLEKERQPQPHVAAESIECIPDPAIAAIAAPEAETIADAPDVDFVNTDDDEDPDDEDPDDEDPDDEDPDDEDLF